MNAPPRPDALTARWVVPVDGDPVRGGTVELAADGAVTALHDRPDARGGAVDLGAAALLPGLVNCHTHLEFSDFETPIPATGTFADWVAATVAARRSRGGDVMTRVNRGLRESLAAGVTTVGEIATAGWDVGELLPPLERPNLVAFGEVIAPRDPVAGFDAAGRFLADAAADPPDLARGLSPHAPYSIHPATLALLTAEHGPRVPLAVHLLETREEVELMRDGTGPLVAAMARLDATRGDFGADRLRADFLHPLSRAARGLIVHGNFLDRADIEWLSDPARSHLSVVLCPRTHAHFGNPPHPWRDLRAAGVRVGLGTDGRGSNPDLSVWNEVRFLRRRFSDVPPATLIRLATADGAAALGARGGRIAPDEPADLCAIQNAGRHRRRVGRPVPRTRRPRGRLAGRRAGGVTGPVRRRR